MNKGLFLLLFPFFLSCAGQDIFPDLGGNLSSPLTIAIDTTNARAYLNNSNSRVEYDWEQGSVQALDLTNPVAPTLLKTGLTKSYSGQMVLDSVNSRLLVSNRFSAAASSDADRILSLNISNPSATNFLEVTEVAADRDPFGVAYDSTNNRLLVASLNNKLQYYDLGAASLSATSLALDRALDDGTTLTTSNASRVAVLGNQAFVSRLAGGVLVINLSEIGDSSKNPVDYYLSDIHGPRGLVAEGSYLYAPSAQVESGRIVYRLMVVKLDQITADNTNTTVIVKNTTNTPALYEAKVAIGDDPQEVVLNGTHVFVSNQGDDTVSVVKRDGHTLEKTFTVGDQPFGMGLYTVGPTTYLYVCNVRSNTVSIIDVSGTAVTASYP